MKIWMKLVCFALAAALSLGAVACGPRKPAYSDVNPNQGARNGNQNSSGQPAAPTEGASAESLPPAIPPPAAPQQTPFKAPEFLDQTTGEIKDLPSYPNAVRQNIQYGPVQDQDKMKDTMALLLATGDPMNKIADFYDKAVKSNGWTVSDKLRDQELSQWVLKKGNDNEAKVEIRKDPKSNAMFIALARTQTLTTPKQ
jgi:hypothetical protein